MNEQSELGPRIYHRQDTGAEGGIDPRDMFERGDRAYFYVDQSFVSIMDDLKKLPRANEQEKSRINERLSKNWERLMVAELGQVEDILDNQLLRFKNPYPYESRQPAMWFSSLQEAARKAKNEEWANNPDAAAWMNRVIVATTWAENNFRLIEGVGGVIDKFFDGKQMMEGWVRERFRSDPVATYYQLTFAGKVPGLISEESATQDRIEHKNLREMAVSFQDQSMFWRMAVASVHQIDLTESSAPPSSLMDPEALPLVRGLTEKETEFIRAVFAARTWSGDIKTAGEIKYIEGKNGRKFPAETLNWYAMASSEEYKRRYVATMEALLLLDIKNRLEAPNYQVQRDPGGNPVFNEEMNKLIEEVVAHAHGRLANWFSTDRKLKEQLADVVIKSGIIFDIGHFSVSQMAWGWDYKAIKPGDTGLSPQETKLGVKRERAEGATTVASDIPNMAKWFSYHSSTDVKAWPVGMFPPLEEEYRREINRAPMGWVPKLYDEKSGNLSIDDSKLRALWNELWNDTTLVTWDPAVREWMQKHAWYITTPLKDKDTALVFPMFFPPEFDSLNFLNTITLIPGGRKPQSKVENGRIEAGGASAWEELRNRKNLSSLEWSSMGDQALYRWLITIGQTIKPLMVILEQEGGRNKDQFEDFFGGPARLKEFIKRSDLGVRDEKHPTPILTLSLVPMLIALHEAQKHGIIGSAGDDIKRRSLWAADIAKWTAMLRNLPKEREGMVNYGRQMARILEFYAVVIARIGRTAGKVEKYEAEKIYKEELSPRLTSVGVGIEDQIIDTKPELRTR